MSENIKPIKGPNEKFCNECGKIINAKAEICPLCGVRQQNAQVSESPNIIKTILKWVLLVVLIVFIVSFIIGFVSELMGDEESEYQESSSAISSSEPILNSEPISSSDSILEVSPQQIYRDYESNEIAADQKYKGKLLRVTGIVDSIDSDFVDEAVVELDAGGFLETVSAEGDSDFTHIAATLSKGQQVTVLCIGAGEILGFPMLDDCVFQ